MEQHHQDAIAKFVSLYSVQESVLAILVAGSIAHSFEKPNSDVDIILVVDDHEYEARQRDKKLAFSLWDICTYEGGYVDCKVVNLAFLELVAKQGSDAARFAFEGAQIVFSKISELEAILADIVRFPIEEQESRRRRFISQILAWKWYFSQGIEKNDAYLRGYAAQKMILFACRIILNENQMLFPFHKWLIVKTKTAKNKPERFDSLIEQLATQPDDELVKELADLLLKLLGLEEKSIDWPNQYMMDSEFNWLYKQTPVDDL
jgi:predicted nucleotidyltransferase